MSSECSNIPDGLIIFFIVKVRIWIGSTMATSWKDSSEIYFNLFPSSPFLSLLYSSVYFVNFQTVWILLIAPPVGFCFQTNSSFSLILYKLVVRFSSLTRFRIATIRRVYWSPHTTPWMAALGIPWTDVYYIKKW